MTCFALHFVTSNDVNEQNDLTSNDVANEQNDLTKVESMSAKITCGETENGDTCVQSISFPETQHNIFKFLVAMDNG